ncbi:UPF0488 protein C8orf33 homolog isoform X2 [Rhinoraja longicauda]
MEEAPKERMEAALDGGVQQLQADICQLMVTAQDPSPGPVEIQHHGLDSSSVAEHRSCSHRCNFQFNFTIPEGGSEDPAGTPPAHEVRSSCTGDSGTAQQGRSGDTSDCLPATGEERPLCRGAASQDDEFKFNFAIPVAGADVNRTGESTADPTQSQQLGNVESTASKSTRKKKKRNRTQSTKPQAGIPKDPEQLSQNSQQEVRNSMGLSPEEQLQREVDWCIEQLELGLQSQKNTQKQGEEAVRALRTLHSKRPPLVKKRQLMRSMFGDYRKKMEEERQRQFRLMLTATKSASIKSVKEQTRSKVLGKIATKSPKVDAAPASSSVSPEKITVEAGEPAPFRFNFF